MMHTLNRFPSRSAVLTLLVAFLLTLTVPSAIAQDENAEATDQTTTSTISVPTYVVRPASVPEGGYTPLGDLDDDSRTVYLEFSPFGAGVSTIQLPDEFETVKFEKHVTLQSAQVNSAGLRAVPFAAVSVDINGVNVVIGGSDTAPLWTQTAPGEFELYIDDADGVPQLRIERRFQLKPENRHGFILTETMENLSDAPVRVVLNTLAMVDLAKAESTYGGDRRRVRYGYLLPPEQQGASMRVQVDNELFSRNRLLGKREATQFGKAYIASRLVWPSEDVLPKAQRLSWLGFTDRYFAVAIHPVFDANSITSADQKLLSGIARIDRYMLEPLAETIDATQALGMQSVQYEIAPGASQTRQLGVYAGLRNKKIMNAEPMIAAINMPEMVVSNLGGICAPCTFQWLAHMLIDVLRLFESIVQDWAISIILLVFLVRSCLHPITRWSQIRLQKFSVQMQAMAPKQKAIRDKYKDDSKKMQQEMAKLWKEEGINPAGALGCLPMFLQTPVWIALYATLFFATELRHEPAFYGIFQSFGNWGFMSDLAAPDGAIPLPASMHFSFPLWGSVTSINLLPLLMGVLMFLHQKYLTPPTTASLTPEQESQQKLMKVMMVVMFPLMMYAAPSGLALYFITNSTVGILENKWIRAHMKKHGMLEIENIKAEKAKKGPGFMARMMQAAEAQQQIREKGPKPINPASKEFNRRQK
ncbi:MAG: YidC/Oxa1 family membrane protein insertase [Phycisphaerales bacterium]